MTKNELAFILKYSSPSEIYVVSHENRLILIVCPFRVKVRGDIGNLLKDQIVMVEEIKVTANIITVFIVKNEPYFYFHFEILVPK